MNTKFAIIAVVASTIAIAGCESTPARGPTIQTGPNAEVTVDGLHRVDNSKMALAYVKPDVDLSSYTKIMLGPVSIAYKKEPRGTGKMRTAHHDSNFAMTPQQTEKMKGLFQESAVDALTSENGYQVVSQPGPDVLRVSCELIDLVVTVPTEEPIGRSRTFAESYGAVTLVVELRDSETGEIFARVADRKEPGSNFGMNEVSRVTVTSDLKRLFKFWSGYLREGVDKVRSI
jgi:hypothetical protein